MNAAATVMKKLNSYFANMVLFSAGIGYNVTNLVSDLSAMTQMSPKFWGQSYKKKYFSTAATEILSMLDNDGKPSLIMELALNTGFLDDGMIGEMTGMNGRALLRKISEDFISNEAAGGLRSEEIAKNTMRQMLTAISGMGQDGFLRKAWLTGKLGATLFGVNPEGVKEKKNFGIFPVSRGKAVGSPKNEYVSNMTQNQKGFAVGREMVQRLAYAMWVMDEVKDGNMSATVAGGSNQERLTQYLYQQNVGEIDDETGYTIKKDEFLELKEADQWQVACYISAETFGDYQDVGTMEKFLKLVIPFWMYPKIDVRRQAYSFMNFKNENQKGKFGGMVAAASRPMVAYLAAKTFVATLNGLWDLGRDEPEEYDEGFLASMLDLSRYMSYVPLVKWKNMEIGWNLQTAQTEFLQRFGIGGAMEGMKGLIFNDLPDKYQSQGLLKALGGYWGRDLKDWAWYQLSPGIKIPALLLQAMIADTGEEYKAIREFEREGLGVAGRVWGPVITNAFNTIENAWHYHAFNGSRELKNMVNTGMSYSNIKQKDMKQVLNNEFRYETLPFSIYSTAKPDLVKVWPVKKKFLEAVYKGDKDQALRIFPRLLKLDWRPRSNDNAEDYLEKWMKTQSPYAYWLRAKGVDIKNENESVEVYNDWLQNLNQKDTFRAKGAYRWYYQLLRNTEGMFGMDLSNLRDYTRNGLRDH